MFSTESDLCDPSTPYESIQEPDMKQMAVIVASFVYLTANRDEMVPRKPLQKTRPKPPQR